MASPQPSLWSPYHHLKITTLIVLLFLFCSSFSSAAENETTTTTTTSTTTTASPTTTAPPSPAPSATVLRHLQIVFRHGDRAPLEPLFPNDPFRSLADWPHGLDQLTNEGRARMFRLGQMIRQKYGHYLGDEFSPREIFARSSAIDRCLESAQLVLAGSYPPNSSTWQWDKNGSPLPLAKLWQPIPVASFLPPNDDSLLRTKRPCPKAESERQAILTSPAMKKLLAEHASLLSEVSRISGLKVDEIIEADRFHENTIIEHENGLFWADRLNGTAGFNWTKEYEKEVVLKLKPFSYARWNNEWNSRLIQRVRAGELLATLGDNFHQKRSIRDVENSDQNKLVLFSSHDTKVAALLWALDLWNGIFIPYGAAVLFELHQLVVDGSNVTSASTDSGYFVAVKYYNETMSLLEGKNNSLGGSSTTTFKDAHALSLPKCAGKEFRPEGSPPLCPLETFLELVEQFKVANWDEECGIDQYSSDGNYLSLINVLLLIANLVVLGVLLLLVMYFITKVRSRPGYQPLE